MTRKQIARTIRTHKLTGLDARIFTIVAHSWLGNGPSAKMLTEQTGAKLLHVGLSLMRLRQLGLVSVTNVFGYRYYRASRRAEKAVA